MKHIHTLLAAAALALCAACFSSCKKDNPAEVNYASADFVLKISEERQSHTFEWDVISNAVSIDPAEQKLQELWVTKWNKVTVTALPKDAGFEGVNYSSLDPKSVKVIKVDDQTCTLEYIADSSSPVTISANAGSYVHSFKVHSKEVIELEGVAWQLKGRTGDPIYLESKLIPGKWKGSDYTEQDLIKQRAYYKKFDSKEEYLAFMPATTTILNLIPENASFRRVVNFRKPYYIDPEEGTPLPSQTQDIEGTCNKDFSELQGKSAAWAAGTQYGEKACIQIAFRINTLEEKGGYVQGVMLQHFEEY